MILVRSIKVSGVRISSSIEHFSCHEFHKDSVPDGLQKGLSENVRQIQKVFEYMQ